MYSEFTASGSVRASNMNPCNNHLGQPIGLPVGDWPPCKFPPGDEIVGRFCKLERLDAGLHGPELFMAFSEDKENRIWTYLPYGPFRSADELSAWIDRQNMRLDPMFFVIIDRKMQLPVGVASFLNIRPSIGVVEVGHINFSPSLQRTRCATEAMFLMMRSAFDELGYRRYEWKCDALNLASRRAAERLGFLFEGIFRQATIYKFRNRDSAWFSIIDKEWPKLKLAFHDWLSDSNFDENGKQLRKLSEFMERVRDPRQDHQMP